MEALFYTKLNCWSKGLFGQEELNFFWVTQDSGIIHHMANFWGHINITAISYNKKNASLQNLRTLTEALVTWHTVMPSRENYPKFSSFFFFI